ncbi:comF family protein [Pedobacter steynii]|uniref:ComF family protein n=1 Tax=Pedobacter steynii TaxID=430522 RepID=A0A1G9WP52_9SPHI|nr:ComF family protein [Pedobacter steynii]NQX40346.1 ComF family protein [Pedobacter steynii]SDM85946.1 comF family protein [Pedobacter steynii]
MPLISSYFNDFLSLLFPNLCSGCGTSLYRGESQLCSKCLYNLPYTDHHLHEENKVAKQFWGRIPCHAAMAMLFFRKGGRVQQIIHHLKYSNQPELGIKLGKLLGERLLLAPAYQHIDLIIPVPLHKKRERQRGYNQSAGIAEGIAEVLQIPMSKVHLLRKSSTDSQTRKGRSLRFENMSKAFEVRNGEALKDKHILLVDDVMTTGATLEACGLELLKCGINKVSFATLAFVG